MDNSQTTAQKIKIAERKALKIGAIGTLVSMFIISPIFAPFVFGFIAALSNVFLRARAKLPFVDKPYEYEDDDAEERHKANLINMPVISSLSVYHNAGVGYQHYHHHSQFHR